MVSFAVETEGSSSQTLGDLAFERLRRDIVNGALLPREKLRFDFLRQRYGMNVGALREALSRLAAQGLVISRSQRGFIVAPMSEAELRDVTQLRCMIDTLALRTAIERGDLDWETRLLGTLHRLSKTPRAASEKPDELSEQWIASHRDFHRTLLSGCNSPVIMQTHDMLFDHSERYRRISFKVRVANRDWNSDHRAIVEAALDRDAERACALLEKHIRGVSAKVGQASRTRKAAAAEA